MSASAVAQPISDDRADKERTAAFVSKTGDPTSFRAVTFHSLAPRQLLVIAKSDSRNAQLPSVDALRPHRDDPLRTADANCNTGPQSLLDFCSGSIA
jgi:hypothetical protein